jgi:hypothetical protein
MPDGAIHALASSGVRCGPVPRKIEYGGVEVDPKKFDDVIRQLSQRLSRRSVVGGSLGATVLSAVGLGAADDAEAKNKGPKKDGGGKNKGPKKDGGGGKNKGPNKDSGGGKNKGPKKDGGGGKNKGKAKSDALPCLADGQACPKRTKVRPAKNGKKARFRQQTCGECCSGRSVNGVCGCTPNGSGCANAGECCSGICTAGLCRTGPFFS